MLWLLIIVGALAALVTLLALVGLAYQAVGTARDLRRYPPPGRLIDIGGYRLHLLTHGEGSPTVVMDSGLPGTVLSWGEVQPQVASFARTCSYDRPGLGWSEAGPEPRTVRRIVTELHSLLTRAGIGPPYILVGHSFGGLTARLFTSTYPDEVVGLVLVDPVHPQDWLEENLSAEQKGKLRGGARLARYGARLARFGIARFTALLGRTVGEGTAQSFVSLLTGGAVRGGGALAAPISKLPPEQRPMVGAFWKQPKVYQAMAGQVESLPESAAQVVATGDYGDLPLIVLTAENGPASQKEQGERLASRSSRGRHIRAAGSGHWIHLDEPTLVIKAIREVIEEAQVAAEKNRAQEAEK